MKNLIIVDDSRMFQKVLQKNLSPFFQVVGVGSSGEEGYELYKKLKPNLVLMDITMPNCSGKEALKKIIEEDPSAVVIMVSSIGDEHTVNDCLALGAKAFVKKEDISFHDTENSILIQTIIRVANGEVKQGVA